MKHFGCSAEVSSVFILFLCKDHQLLNELILSIKQFCKKWCFMSTGEKRGGEYGL